MPLTTDFHSHVVRSSATQMVESARQRGVSILGLSEHVFQMREVHPLLQHLPQEGPLLTFAEYVEAVQSASQKLQFDVRLGLEVDFIPEKNERIQASLQGYPWDFLLGSLHEIDNVQFEQHAALTREEGEAFWWHYLELLRAAVNSGYFDVVSHPVRMRKRNPHIPDGIDEVYEQLAAEATRCNVALEVNGYDVLNYPDMVRRFVKACASQHTPISVGSDAHNPTQVAQAHQQTETILREAGMTTIRIWKQRIPEDISF